MGECVAISLCCTSQQGNLLIPVIVYLATSAVTSSKVSFGEWGMFYSICFVVRSIDVNGVT